jgi:hypothetical protein
VQQDAQSSSAPEDAGLDIREAGGTPATPIVVRDLGREDIAQLKVLDGVATASFVGERDTVDALRCVACGGKEPADSDDPSLPRFTWFNHQGTEEWVQYAFDAPKSVSAAGVYWYVDDVSSLLPVAWELRVQDATGQFQPVHGKSDYRIARDAYNWITFDRVETRAIRLVAQLPPNKSAGILRWKVFDAALPRPLGVTSSSTGILDKAAILAQYAHSERPWHIANIPFFDAPDASLREIYYFRFWNYRQNIRLEPSFQGWVVREGASYGITVCPAGHHLYEGRWLHDTQYVDDTIRYWYSDAGERRKYSNWLADGLYAHYLVHGDSARVTPLLPDLERNQAAWDMERFDESRGLYKWIPDRDGMEASVAGFEEAASKNLDKGTVLLGGEGYRPSLNSYMVAELRAIANVARLAGDAAKAQSYASRADALQAKLIAELWNADQHFFMQRRSSDYGFVGGREEIGFFPWAFGAVDDDAGRWVAWTQLLDPQGFGAPFGPTTLEQRNPYFMYALGYPTAWNGPSWPYSTSVTLAGLANLLVKSKQNVVTKADYWESFRRYVATHYDPDGTPALRESHHPSENLWIAQGANYNHSRFADLVITGLVGLWPRADSTVELHPLAPTDWSYFCLEGVRYHGFMLTIVWDRDGQHYKRGAGLSVWRDRKLIYHQTALGPASFSLTK